MLHTLDQILDDIKLHINEKLPFSLVRIGDGDLKLLACLIQGEINEQKFKRSGVPHEKAEWVLNLYRQSCNSANYTSSFEMYYTDRFWNRAFSKGTRQKVKSWRKIYKQAGIYNKNFCNPEIGYLLFLNESRNLLTVLKDRKVCLITSHPKAAKKLNKVAKIFTTAIEIPDINRGHYKVYKNTLTEIENRIKDVDVFFISAGLLGKGYSNKIKQCGGVAVDIGQVINTWNGRRVAKRFVGILKPDDQRLLFELTKKASQYRKYL
jgi:hypothetical protein